MSQRSQILETRVRPIALNFIGLVLLGAAGFMTGMTVSARLDPGEPEPQNAPLERQQLPHKSGPDVVVDPNSLIPAYQPPPPQI